MKNYETLQDCIEQIEMSDYECEGGYLKNNVGFIRLKELAQVNNLNLPVVTQRSELLNAFFEYLDSLPPKEYDANSLTGHGKNWLKSI